LWVGPYSDRYDSRGGHVVTQKTADDRPKPAAGWVNKQPMSTNDTATENRAGRIDRLDDPREGIAATYDRDNPAAWIRYEQRLLVEVCDER